MKIVFTAEFVKEYKAFKYRDKTLAIKIEKIIDSVRNSSHTLEIPNIKKLKGYKEYFRIRTGKYRLGVKIIEDTVFFAVFDIRDKIYKRFP